MSYHCMEKQDSSTRCTFWINYTSGGRRRGSAPSTTPAPRRDDSEGDSADKSPEITEPRRRRCLWPSSAGHFKLGRPHGPRESARRRVARSAVCDALPAANTPSIWWLPLSRTETPPHRQQSNNTADKTERHRQYTIRPRKGQSQLTANLRPVKTVYEPNFNNRWQDAIKNKRQGTFQHRLGAGQKIDLLLTGLSVFVYCARWTNIPSPQLTMNFKVVIHNF